jgi:hypothetical protein
MKVQRSAAYPSYSLSYCLTICDTIYKNFGTSHRATREELSTALNLSVGNLQMKISSCVQYGLLDMKSKEGYKVTELFVRYKRPIDDNQATSAKIEAFKNPPLYEGLIGAFDGEILPPVRPLSNILYQKYSISESACESAASIFIENAHELNLLSEDNELNVDESKVNKAIEYYEEELPIKNTNRKDLNDNISNSTNAVIISEANTEKNPNNSNQNGFTPSNGVVINILLKDKRTSQLVLPNDAVSSDLDTIINWIRLMKESF